MVQIENNGGRKQRFYYRCSSDFISPERTTSQSLHNLRYLVHNKFAFPFDSCVRNAALLLVSDSMLVSFNWSAFTNSLQHSTELGRIQVAFTGIKLKLHLS